MTQDEIIEMARQASFTENSGFKECFVCNPLSLEAFAKLVDAKATAREREACAKVCDEYAITHGMKGDDNNKAQGWMMMQCGAAIRARGQE